jgi:uncharacterized protein (DUF433 family)
LLRFEPQWPLLSFYQMSAVLSASLGSGAYTLPDASRLLGIPLHKLRTWVCGVAQMNSRRLPAGPFVSRAEGRDRHFDFYTLIELFTIAQLRSRGLAMRTLREARAELSERYGTAHPFALKGLLTDGRHLLKELGDESLLELGSGGQKAFEELIKPFCYRLDFDALSDMAARYFPLGRDGGIVVDPGHAFGRPVVEGTNLPTETIATLVHGGETIEDIATAYQLDKAQVDAAWAYEQRLAA